MKPATRLNSLLEHLHGWSSFHTEWKVKFNSYALVTGKGVALIDPVKPGPMVVKKLEALGEFSGVFLTNANHDRDADWFRKRYEVQVYAHEKASSDCDTKIDVPVMDREKMPGGLKAIYLPGSAAGEIGLHIEADGGILCLGDALLNLAEGLAFLPAKYCEDSQEARKSLKKILALEFKTATFAHGDPLVGDARRQITNFLKKPVTKD